MNYENVKCGSSILMVDKNIERDMKPNMTFLTFVQSAQGEEQEEDLLRHRRRSYCYHQTLVGSSYANSVANNTIFLFLVAISRSRRDNVTKCVCLSVCLRVVILLSL